MIAALLLTLVAQSRQPPRDATLSVAATAEIAGIVLANDGGRRPLNRTRITLSGDAPAAERTTLTDADGAFVFDDLPAGTYTVSAAKDAYLTSVTQRFELASGAHGRVELRLSRGGVITGAVLDSVGQPVQGISVRAFVRRMSNGASQYRDAGSAALPTDDRGTYRIFGLPPGEYVVAAQPSARTIGFEPGEQVRRVSGNGATDRTFAAAHVFYPSTADVSRASGVSVRAGEERSGIDVQLQYVPLATISGTASGGPDWMPARVGLVRLDEVDAGTPALDVLADSDGHFVFTGIPPGQYRVGAAATRQPAPGRMPEMKMEREAGSGVTLTMPLHLIGSVDVAIAGEDITDLSVPLEPPLTMTGRIEFDGARPPMPLASLQVGVAALPALAAIDQRFPALYVTGAAFRADGIEPGAYWFEARPVVRGKAGEWWLKSLVAGGVDLIDLDTPFEIRQNVDGVVATITSRATAVSGTVHDATGRARGGVTVVVFSSDRRRWFFHSRRIAAVEAGEDGRYVIRNLPPGDYHLVAATDLDDNEWFDPAVLERLLPQSTAVSIADAGTSSVDLTIR